MTNPFPHNPMKHEKSVSLPLYSSRIIDTYLKLVRRRYSYVNVSELLHYAHMETHQVADQEHWFSQEQIDLFYSRLVQLTGNCNIAREAGRYAASPEVIGTLRQYVVKAIGAARMFELIRTSAAKMTRSAVYESRRISSNSVEITVTPEKGAEEKPFQCENRIGFMEAIPFMFNYRFPEISHTECMFNGGQVCRYIITWQTSPSETWKKALTWAATCLFAVSIFFFPFSPPVVSMLVVPTGCVILLMCLFVLSRVEKKELEQCLGNLMDSKEQLYDQINQNYNNALMTNEIGQAISKETKTENILLQVIRILEKRLAYDRSIILLADESRSRLLFRTGYGYSPEQFRLLQETVVYLEGPDSMGIIAKTFHHRKPFLINSPEQLEDGMRPHNPVLSGLFVAPSLVCCPIICEDEPLGILVVDNPHTNRTLTHGDLSLLMGIAPLIGISIQNSMHITREMLMTDQLRHSQKVEMIGRLAGGIAHDFNNLLTIIIGYGEILLKRLGQDSALSREVHGIRNAANRAAELTHQLLAYSRRQVLQTKVIDLNDIVAEVSTMFSSLITGDIELTFSPGKDLWRVKTDPCQMGQVLVNLVLNARDAMPLGGTLKIETMNMELNTAFYGQNSIVQPGFYVLLTVSDTGRGMDEKTRSHIFEPFFTTKGVGEGTGLGLASVYGIIRQSGGHIFVDSEPNRGATFKIYLPRAKEVISSVEPQNECTTLLSENDTSSPSRLAESTRRCAVYDER
jgi:signal transduction histidine kinase